METAASNRHIPPHSTEGEQLVLGSLLIVGSDINLYIDRLSEKLFYIAKHRWIYLAIASVSDREEEVDLLTVSNQLKRDKRLGEVGGLAFLNMLAGYVSVATNLDSYVKILAEYSIRREMIKVSVELDKQAKDISLDAFQALESGEQLLFEVGEDLLKGDYIRLGSGINMAELREGKERVIPMGIPSGFRTLDRLTGGWQPGNFVVLAARPSMGKTAIALSILRNLAIDFNKPVGLFSMEMSSIEIAHRWVAMEAGISHDALRSGKLSDAELERIAACDQQIKEAPIFIDETAGMSITELRSRARRMRAKEGISLLVVDYLQLMRGEDRRGGSPNREQEIANISRMLKSLAKELSIPVIAISQLSRAVETRGGDKRPILSDLRESGAIEQDADMVFFLYRPEMYGITEDEMGQSTKGITEVLLSKNRNGQTGKVLLEFQGAYMRFKELDAKVISSKINHPDNGGMAGGMDAPF